MTPIRHVLVANRGEIARRVIRTCRNLGIRTTAVFSTADRSAPFVDEADQAVCIGEGPANESYLDGFRILMVAKQVGADALHPGYGFLSENADFAQAVADAGLVFIGPPPAAMRALGDKKAARQLAARLGVPTVPGYDGDDRSDAAFLEAARSIGYPVLVKASAGGGGRGMRIVNAESELIDALISARREAESAFGSDVLLLEKYIGRPRHIEVQVLGDRHGNVVHLFERECSIQRRHQKIIEEAPSPGVSPELREKLGLAAVSVAKAAGYTNAGTVEFLVDNGAFYLLEMNARLQVEHPVTEMVTRLDLVAEQIAIAEGRPLRFQQHDIVLHGHAIEVRLCAEDPNRDFLPSTGRLVRFDVPVEGPEMRVDGGFVGGQDIPMFYDSMLAKLIAWGSDRSEANRRLKRLVDAAWVPGVVTNLPLLREIVAHPAWEAGLLHTGFLGEHQLPGPVPLNANRGVLAATTAGWYSRRDVIPSGWRIGGPAWQSDHWTSGSETVKADWRASGAGLEIRIDGRVHHLQVRNQRGDRWAVELDGVVQSWRIARSGEGPMADGELIYAHFGDAEAFVQLVPRFPLPQLKVEPGTLTANTPGKVVGVHVAVGDRVVPGQLLIVLEAMKMESRITAQEAGIIAQLRVAVGDTVAQGTLLVRIEPDEPAP